MRFLNIVLQASANAHVGSMYGTINAVLNQRRPNMSVRVRSHANTPPTRSDKTTEHALTTTVWSNGRQNSSSETGERNTRQR